MRILITGAAGFVGCSLVKQLYKLDKKIQLLGIDNFSRKGSRSNLPLLEACNVSFFEGDISSQVTVESLPNVDWIVDCAANPSVLAGIQGSDSLNLINNNLTGTFYLLEKCKRDKAGFILISTNRVYSVSALNSIKLIDNNTRFDLHDGNVQTGVSTNGISELFPTNSPISLYGATKLASEIIALEYHHAFGFPVWINRCGVIAGPGQFGKIDQGIFSFWVYQYLLNRSISFIGFEGSGKQVRDMLHPIDLFGILQKQIFSPITSHNRVYNLGGGIHNTFSLLELDLFCKEALKLDKHIAKDNSKRTYDIPYYATDFTIAKLDWNWNPKITKYQIMDEIIEFGLNNLDHIRAIS
jgi:CDP-paratose 2-epimerase